jgi:hypothetical protein
MIITFRKVALLPFADERVGWNLLIWVQRKRYSKLVVWNRSSFINIMFLLNAGQWALSTSKIILRIIENILEYSTVV